MEVHRDKPSGVHSLPELCDAVPDCYPASLEQPASLELMGDSRRRARTIYAFGVLKLWLFLVCVIGGSVAAFSGFSYAVDHAHKRVPVGVKYALSSVVEGFPSSNSTSEWEAEFKRPEVRVWPYYTVLGLLCTSVLILTVPQIFGLDHRVREHRHREPCHACDGLCCRNNNIHCYCDP
eukprot:PhM_4_TR16087/c1_g1_i3/m.38402